MQSLHLQRHHRIAHIVQTSGHSSCKAAAHAVRREPFSVCLQVQTAPLTQQEGQKRPHHDFKGAQMVTLGSSADATSNAPV